MADWLLPFIHSNLQLRLLLFFKAKELLQRSRNKHFNSKTLFKININKCQNMEQIWSVLGGLRWYVDNRI